MIRTYLVPVKIETHTDFIIGVRIINAMSDAEALGMAYMVIRREYPNALRHYAVVSMSLDTLVEQGHPLYLNGDLIARPA